MSNSTNIDIATLADQYQVAAAVGRDLPEFCETLGVDLEGIAGPLQIDARSFDEFGARVSFDKMCRLMEALAAAARDDTFGLKYGQFFKPGGTGPFGMGMRCAPSFKEMLRFFVNYIHITNDIDLFNLMIEHNRVSLEWTYSPLITHREQFVDYAAAAFLRVFQHQAGRAFKYERLRLERRAPQDKSVHLNSLSKNIEFNADINMFVLPYDVLDRVNPSADKTKFDYMTQQCEIIAKSLRREKDIVTVLKEDFIQNMESNDRAIADVSRRHGMSESTLQRRLSERGTSFWELYENTRDELSMRLLMDTDLPLAEIFLKVGYSSQSAYTRAVKRWHGKTPAQLRKQHGSNHFSG